MDTADILTKLSEHTILQGPYFAEPVRVLTAKARGDPIEIIAERVNTNHGRTVASGNTGFWETGILKSQQDLCAIPQRTSISCARRNAIFKVARNREASIRIPNR